MNQTFYKISLFFSGLILLAGLVQAYFYFQIGTKIYGLESFIYWFLLLNGTSILYHVILLKYFYYKKFQYSFLSFSLVTLAAFVYGLIVFQMLWSRETSNYLPVTFLILAGSGIIYGLTLILSRAAERPWLKLGGVLIFVIDLFLFTTLTWSLQYPGSISNLETYQEWAAQIGLLVPVFYLLNFSSELKRFKFVNEETKLQNTFNGIFGAIGAISLILVLVVGSQIFNTVQWFAQQPQRAQKLAEPFDARIYVSENGDTLKYRLMKPEDPEPQKKYPLVIALHGGAGSGTENLIQVDGSWTAQFLAKPSNREKYPAYLFVPQCPPGSSWGVVPNIPVVDELVFEAIISLEAEFSIDKTRRYVMGESLGGYGTWHFISTRPKMFAAAVPICGGGNPNFAHKIKDVPIWAFHGAQDRIVPVKSSRKMIAALNEAGGNPLYTEFADEGHIISESFENTEGLLDWVFAQQLSSD
ncbi:prolyl oligopeptidase family serine peptidase [Cyclobacterium plantarum]|uniref:carboxylesterase family protein n=1 Tax=Cyclobacterium plantarum TaxID=2716263 RepID=UPI003F6E66AA